MAALHNSTMSDEVPEAENILSNLKMQVDELHFSFLNGSCFASGVRGLSGKLDQQEALALSKQMQAKDDGLICVSKPLDHSRRKQKMKMRFMKSSLGVF